MNNSLIVTRATDESLSSSKTLDYSRIFEIPQEPPEVIAGWIARAVGLASEHTRGNYLADIADLEGCRKGRQITRGLVVSCIQEQVHEAQIHATLWPWKYELLSQLNLATQVKRPRGQRLTDEELVSRPPRDLPAEPG